MMYYSTILALLATTTSTLAAPTLLASPTRLAAPSPLSSSAPLATLTPFIVAPGYWAASSFQRICDDLVNICTFSLSISDGGAASENGKANDNDKGANEKATSSCQYTVSGTHTIPAEWATYSSVICGSYLIGSTYNVKEAFTTLSIVKDGQIIYPAYKDLELYSGQAIGPKVLLAEALPSGMINQQLSPSPRKEIPPAGELLDQPSPLASPTPLKLAPPDNWIIYAFQRNCPLIAGSVACTFSLHINGPANRCHYNIPTSPLVPVTWTPYSDVYCDGYIVGSSYDQQEGFTTLSIAKDGKVVYPAYTDGELESGDAVGPKVLVVEDFGG